MIACLAMIGALAAAQARAASYDKYLDGAIKEQETANYNHSPTYGATYSEIGVLDKRQFSEVEKAIEAVEADPGPAAAAAARLRRWIDSGWILVDRSLDDSISAETRRDAGSKGSWTPTDLAANVSLDGTIYLNPAKELLFFPPPDLAQLKTNLEKLLAKAKTLPPGGKRSPIASIKEQIASIQERLDPRASALYLQSVLVHEERHTEQRWGDKRQKEGEAYDVQLAYLRYLRGEAKDAEAQARLDGLISRVSQDRQENVR